MPQMSPLNWWMIYNLMIMNLFMILSLMYFMYMPNKLFIKMNKNLNLWNFKW